jgi:hypothetical protein
MTFEIDSDDTFAYPTKYEKDSNGYCAAVRRVRRAILQP